MQAENVQLEIEKVLELEGKLETNPSPADYSTLDFLLSAINLGGVILKTMRERGYYSYDAYLTERQRSDVNKKDVFSASYVDGTVKEAISLLKNYIKKQ